METIPKSDCEKIGFFRKTHGVSGELVLEFEAHFEYSVEEATRFFVEIDGLLVPFFVSEDGLRFKSSKSAIVQFDNVTSEKYAKRLVGVAAYLWKEEIVDEEPVTDDVLVGYKLLDQEMGEIGTIEAIDDYAGNIVFTVNRGDNELLVPFHEEILVELDEPNKRITLKLPDGLLDD